MDRLSPNPPLADMRAFFASVALPTGPVLLAPGSTIVDAQRFVTGHLAAAGSEASSRRTRGLFYRRLVVLFHLLSSPENEANTSPA